MKAIKLNVWSKLGIYRSFNSSVHNETDQRGFQPIVMGCIWKQDQNIFANTSVRPFCAGITNLQTNALVYCQLWIIVVQSTLCLGWISLCNLLNLLLGSKLLNFKGPILMYFQWLLLSGWHYFKYNEWILKKFLCS